MYRYKKLYDIQHNIDEVYADSLFDSVPFSILILLRISYDFVGIVANYFSQKGK